MSNGPFVVTIHCPDCDGFGTTRQFRTRLCKRCWGSNKEPNGKPCGRCACKRCGGEGVVNDIRNVG